MSLLAPSALRRRECAAAGWRVVPALAAIAILAAAASLGCAGPPPAPRGTAYVPRTREITITTVPLLVKESARTFPFLTRDFARGGVLEGKEVYAFSPSTITVVQGDTVRFTFVDPEDDPHTFVLGDLHVALPGQQVSRATWIARHAGVMPFTCDMPGHRPMMWGQMVVLAPVAVADAPPADAAEASRR